MRREKKGNPASQQARAAAWTMPDAWTHPAAVALRESADTALAQAQAALAARQVALRSEGSPSSGAVSSSTPRSDLRLKWTKSQGPGTGWGRGRRETKGTPSKSPPQSKSPRPGGHPRRARTPDELDLGKDSRGTTRWPPMGQHQRSVKVTPRARGGGGGGSGSPATLGGE